LWWVTGVSLGVFLREITLKENAPVTLTDSDLSELLAAVKAGDMTDTIRTSLAWVLQLLIEAELTTTIGANPHERTEARTAQRNGHRPKLVTTASGDIEPQISKLRAGSFFRACWSVNRRSTGRCSLW